jgi:peptidoglycan/LPS O-acetylase OafA/YrhL
MTQKLKPEFSLYLDLVRFAAAALVLVYHSNRRYIIDDIVPFGNMGHEAVVIFFVLSGFVIAYVADGKESTFTEYWLSRLARLYSVALPALVLTLVLDQAGQALDPSIYTDTTTHDWVALRFLTSLFFVNEIWFVSIMAYSNVPYWSLCYEFWYYFLFSIAFFARDPYRWPLVALVCLALGPKIVLLAPIWWLGVVLYRSKRLARIPEAAGWLLFAASFVAFVVFMRLEATEFFSGLVKQLVGAELHHQLVFSKFFIGDYLLGLVIFANFCGFRAIAHRFAAPLTAIGQPIRFLAGYTFALYLFHDPLILFFTALYRGDPTNKLFYVAVVASAVVAVLVLGYFTEKRKSWLKEALRQAWAKAAGWSVVGAIDRSLRRLARPA